MLDVLGHSRGTRQGRLRNSVPASYAKTVLEIAVERGADPERVLDGSGLTAEALDTPDLRIPAAEAARIVFNALELTGDEGLGIELGLRSKPTQHGYVGFAAMSARTLREAVEVGARFLHLRQRDAGFTLSTEGGHLVLEARDHHEIGPLRRFFLEGLVVTFYRLGSFLLGEPKLDAELWFDWPEPDYFAHYRDRLPTVRFSMPSVAVRLPASHLDRRLIMSDSAAARTALEQCERETALSDPGPDNLLDRVRTQLVAGPDGYPDQEQVASRLAMSARTLKRKLQEHGTTFRTLVDDARLREALRMLDNPDLDVGHIAFSLGYSDPACFTRAFRRWSGQTPTQARARRLMRSDPHPS